MSQAPGRRGPVRRRLAGKVQQVLLALRLLLQKQSQQGQQDGHHARAAHGRAKQMVRIISWFCSFDRVLSNVSVIWHCVCTFCSSGAWGYCTLYFLCVVALYALFFGVCIQQGAREPQSTTPVRLFFVWRGLRLFLVEGGCVCIQNQGGS